MGMDRPMSETVTVLVPMYNREKYIGEAIQSILEQTYTNLIVQVYDDGSTDRSIDIVKSFKDSRIQLTVGDKNRGVSFARNQLLDLCTTKYAAWQDSDDLSNIHRLEYQMNVFEENCIIFTRFKTWSKEIDYHQVPEFYTTTGVNASTLFPVDKEIRFNEGLIRGEDTEWLSRMYKKYHTKQVDYILYYIRYHKDRLGSKCKK